MPLFSSSHPASHQQQQQLAIRLFVLLCFTSDILPLLLLLSKSSSSLRVIPPAIGILRRARTGGLEGLGDAFEWPGSVRTGPRVRERETYHIFEAEGSMPFVEYSIITSSLRNFTNRPRGVVRVRVDYALQGQ